MIGQKAVIVDVFFHLFALGDVVTQVGERDEDGHIPFENEAGLVQYLGDTDFEYIEGGAAQ